MLQVCLIAFDRSAGQPTFPLGGGRGMLAWSSGESLGICCFFLQQLELSLVGYIELAGPMGTCLLGPSDFLCCDSTLLVPCWVVTVAAHALLLPFFPLFWAVCLLMQHYCTVATSSFVLAVLCYMAKLVAPIALVHLDSIIIRLEIKVLSLKNNATPASLLCCYYANKVLATQI
jgi:hypothetical protein